MTAYYIVGVIVLLLIILLMTRGGAAAEYSDDGFTLYVRFGFIRVRILPGKGKEKKKKEKKKKEKKKEPEKAKKGGTLEKLRLWLPGILKFLNGFRKKLRIDKLTVWYMAAGDDPSSTALSYGGISAAMGILTSALENALNIKERDFRATVSFTETKPRVYLKAAASIRLGQILYLGIRLGVYLLRHRPSKKVAERKVDK